MQAMTEKKDKECFSWNPSIRELASRVGYTRKVIRYNGTRQGIVKGEKAILHSVDTIEKIDDNSEFIKLYLDYNSIIEYNKLSSTARQILSYIFKKTDYNKDHFYKLDGEISKHTGLSYSVLYKGFKELVEKKWVFKSDVKLKYWININLFFKGNRDVLLENYFKVTN